MQSLIQRRFWIPGICYLLRSIVFKCLPCYRYKATPIQPFMSSLPSSRFQKGRAFVNTGVDLAGPYAIKENKRRNARSSKGWVVLFICLSTRAVYLDLVTDLTGASFLATLDRFVARRGIPTCLYSDMGTNFVGAARELRQTAQVLLTENESLRVYCEERSIRWKFNPPAAPNFGGSWESAVRCMKHHLRRVLGEQSLTYEEFSTLLAKVEAILNSQPLTQISSNPTDGFDYLTPGHFIAGAPSIGNRLEVDLTSEPLNFNARWGLISRSVQDFWRRWSRKYLHTLMQRSKWDTKIPNVQPGTLVLLRENNQPPSSWPIGRIINCYPGHDGVVRVVQVRTPNGIITRPLNKSCLMPYHEDSAALPAQDSS